MVDDVLLLLIDLLLNDSNLFEELLHPRMMPVFVNDVVADEPEHADGNTEIEIEVGKF